MDLRGVRGGDVVDLVASNGAPLGRGFLSTRSDLAVRVSSFGRQVAEDEVFFRAALDAALAHRERYAPGVDALRIVNAEGDGLPGLIIDRYADVVSIQTLTEGTERLTPLWLDWIAKRLAPRSVIERNDSRGRELEGLDRRTGVLAGEEPGEVEIHQGPARLRVAPLEGQKTGAFLDQRENREAAAGHARGRVLDVFSCEGAFAVRMALESDVGPVLAIDSSKPALERVKVNAELNGVDVETCSANAFDRLRELSREGQRYDTIVLDPPAFARSRASIEAATRGYKEINLRGLKLLEPGGVLVTCSCSHHMTEERFLDVIRSAARDARRDVTLLERRGQALDHPVRLSVPETAYLKCLVLKVS